MRLKRFALFLFLLLLLVVFCTLSSCFSCEHQWDEPTCTKSSVCNLCGEENGEPLGHKLVVDKAISPTCIQEGLTEGKHCSVCDYIHTAQEMIPAPGHKKVVDQAVEPTCSEYGLTEGTHCEVCNKIIISQEEIDKLEHTEGEWKLSKEATLVENGVEKVYCSVCGGFIDSRYTSKKLPKVEGNCFNFTDEEFIDWMNENTNSNTGYSDLSGGDMGDNRLYRIEFDGEAGGIILNHGNNGKYGNVCAIMVWYDDWQTSAVIAAYIGGEMDLYFSADDAIYPLINGDSYTKGDLTAKVFKVSDDFIVAALAPSEFFAELFS